MIVKQIKSQAQSEKRRWFEPACLKADTKRFKSTIQEKKGQHIILKLPDKVPVRPPPPPKCPLKIILYTTAHVFMLINAAHMLQHIINTLYDGIHLLCSLMKTRGLAEVA